MKRRRVEEATKKFQKLSKLPPSSLILSLIPYEIHCGQHSGFPDCCIKFWISKWVWADPDSVFRKNHWKLLNKTDANKKHSLGYIACPKCLKNKTFVKVKPCPQNCKLKILLWGKYWWWKNE